MIRKIFSIFATCAFAFCALGLLWAMPAFSQTVRVQSAMAQSVIVVDTFADAIDTNLDCSLREAIIAANTSITVDGCVAGSEINVILLESGTYVLEIAGRGEQATQTGDLDITVPTKTVTIQGMGVASTTVDAGALDRAFDIVDMQSHVTISDMTIQNGRVITGEGSGAIKNRGTVTLTNLLIQNNVVEGNTSDGVGGAICNGCGGGGARMLIVNSTIRNNAADRAGGIFNNSYLTVTESSLISNSARAGGGLITFASIQGGVMIINTTFSGNIASNNGGGIAHSDGPSVIINSTFANNQSGLGAAINFAGGVADIRNTLMADNVGPNCFERNPGVLISAGNNMSSDDSCNFTASSDHNSTDPQLLPLSNDEGDTPLHRLSVVSVAIDAGSDVQCPATDQRGVTRPQGDGCDIGAFEFDNTLAALYLPLLEKEAP